MVRDMSELTALSPDEVKSVDIITRPGAKYPSEVTSVIIIHRKKKSPHTAGVVNMKGELAEVLSGMTNADFSYLNGNGLGFFAGAGYSNNGYEVFHHNIHNFSTYAKLWHYGMRGAYS